MTSSNQLPDEERADEPGAEAPADPTGTATHDEGWLAPESGTAGSADSSSLTAPEETNGAVEAPADTGPDTVLPGEDLDQDAEDSTSDADDDESELPVPGEEDGEPLATAEPEPDPEQEVSDESPDVIEEAPAVNPSKKRVEARHLEQARDVYHWPVAPDERHTRRVLPWLDWKYSIILPVALLLGVVTLLWQLTNRTELVTFVIQDASTGASIAGAEVAVGNDLYLANDEGTVTLERPGAEVSVRVEAEGYIGVDGKLTDESARDQVVTLRPATLVGRLTDDVTGEPIAGATVSVADPTGAIASTTRTDESGRYRLTDVPEEGQVQIAADRYGTHTQVLDGSTELSLRLAVSVASGEILDDAGNPVQGAVIRSGEAMTVTGADGLYTLENVRAGWEATVTATGYETQSLTLGADAAQVRLERKAIKAVYANLGLLGTPGGVDELIEIANTTEINAIVIDIKQDTIYYDSEVQFFLDAGTVRPVYDVTDVLAKLEANDIYAIARLVVFQDPLVARARPDLAVHDLNGELWMNEMGVAWVSAFNEELWDANIALALEALGRGFDEIQYDYVRFPSDGDLTTADFGREYTAEAREQAITEFVRRSHEAISGAGGVLAADLFGFVTIIDDEQYIGQRFSALEPYLDYVCMMIYPSHFEEGNIASAPGHPNDYPYETILESLERAERIVPGAGVKFRPWLQDFSYGFNDLRDYTAADVRAQIKAAEEFGTSGWMLWGDPFNITVEALKPEPGGE